MKRRDLEKLLKDREYEISNMKIESRTNQVLEDELKQYAKDCEKYRDTLEKE